VWAGVFAVAAAAVAQVTGAIRFEDVTAKAAIDYTANSSPTEKKNQPETMVAGVALLDFDNDGRLDIYFVNGAAIPSLKKESEMYWNRLYRNKGDGSFEDVTVKAGVKGEGYGMGAAVGDFDNDGWPDIFVANVTKNQLYRNNHDGTFTDVTDKAGVGGAVRDGRKMWAVSAAWVDYDNDGQLDLFVSNYCVWEVNKDPFCGPSPQTRAYCHPKNYLPLPNSLFRNNGDGTFTDVSAETGIAKHEGKGMGAVIADYDGDGWTDIFEANDNHPNFLFHNLGGKKFEEVAFQLGAAYAEGSNVISGMGADFKDVDGDGRPDIWHTAIENETFPLFVNVGGREFFDMTAKVGLYGTRNMSGWSNGIFDFDNDGWKDLFVARGNVLDNVAKFSVRKYEEPNAVFRNLGKGKFKDVSAEAGPDFQVAAPHRGVAFGDLDNDGRVDAVVSILNGKAKVMKNASPGENHWLSLKLVGTKSNRMGIGAKVRVTGEDGLVQWNQGTTATGYACSSDARVHFGMAKSKVAREVEITWPSRIKQVLKDVAADQVLVVEEAATTPR
jgi:hypothetical protein